MKAIAAMSSNRVIGVNGGLPWKIKGDLQFFKKMTTGCRCIVGRKTFESLPKLADRKFVVLTSDRDFMHKEHKNEVVGVCFEKQFVPVYGDDTWVIGGAETYRWALPACTDLYLTRVLKHYEGDTLFPSFEHLFVRHDVIESTPEYIIIHYKRRIETKL